MARVRVPVAVPGRVTRVPLAALVVRVKAVPAVPGRVLARAARVPVAPVARARVAAALVARVLTPA